MPITLPCMLGLYSQLSYADSSCLLQQNANYALVAEQIMPSSATAMSGLGSGSGQNILSGCTQNSVMKLRFQVDSLSDLDPTNILQNGQYTFFKIRSLSGQITGNAALNYLVAHAYIALTLSNSLTGKHVGLNTEASQVEGVNLFEGSDQYQLLNPMQNQFDVGVDVPQARLYLDAMPQNDDIIDQLNHLNIALNIGHFIANLIAVDEDQSLDDAIYANTVTTYTQSRLQLSISGINILKPTCIVEDQEVILSPVSSSAFDHAAFSAQVQPFQLRIDCNGYLNQRNFTLKITDNNQINNINSVGFLSNVIGDYYSNVGVQILNEQHLPVLIGSEQDSLSQQSGSHFVQQMYARYYLNEAKVTVGKVYAQATILLNYK
ncbi:fimbrial protein [Acinetobacter sp. 194]|uniref:fimbrial protein n=1 Tax=Acinetobacter shaoyimingii TaxID=2715164 RepID=UPI00140D075C|nr:fimbrial protein [Acinetobacter shaoyimingii]NHB58635.1 fimbrial protein [Acinetobacter shaoyimingii]